MRFLLRFLLLLSAVLVSTPSGAQLTRAPGPGTISVPTDADRRTAAEYRVTAVSMGARRSLDGFGGGSIGRTNLTMRGFEGSIRSPSGLGLSVRYASGTSSTVNPTDLAGTLSEMETRFHLGGYGFAIEPGVLLREQMLEDQSRKLLFLQGGVRVHRLLGSSGVTIVFAGSYRGVPAPVQSEENSNLQYAIIGLQGETAVMYAPPIIPAHVYLGYRLDTWRRSIEEAGQPTIKRHEATSIMVMGIGLQRGMR